MAALQATAELSWGTDDDIARIAFWATDAPHHEADAEKVAEQVLLLRSLGVRIHPVAMVRVDRLTEFTLRASAQVTKSRYFFLTDPAAELDSSSEATLPCYYVSRLKDAVLRSVKSTMSGQHLPISSDEIHAERGYITDDGKCFGLEASAF